MLVPTMLEVSFESTRTMTAGEFAAWAQARPSWDENHYELLNGRIVMNPPAGYPHGSVESRVLRVLGNFAAETELGEVLGSSQGFQLPSGDTVEPDCSFVAAARWRSMPAPVLGSFLEVVPDLVVEILSGSTASHDRGEKKAIYERNGVREYWLIDPRRREVTRFAASAQLFDGGRVFVQGERLESEVLPGLVVEVVSLFP
jgi:Uma2 family endonuclease